MPGHYVTSDATVSISEAAAVVYDVAFASTCRAIYVGTSGNLSVVLAKNSTTIIFPNVPVGWFQVQATKVNTTGTTIAAAQLFAGW